MTNTIKVTKLDNGLTIATDTIETVESVSLGIWSSAGARHENINNNGVAHFLEHMVFKGTKNRSARQIAEEIENVGGHLNAYTSREMTAYYARVLNENLPLAFDLISDVLLNATFDAHEMERERGVILQEIGMYQDSPDDMVFDHAQRTAYTNHSLGRPILGTVETVGKMQRDDLFSFFDHHYQAPQLVLSASGKVDHDHLVNLAQERLSRVSDHTIDPHQKALYTGGEFRFIKDLEQVHFILGFEGVSYRNNDFYTAAILSIILGGGMSSRLFQEIREKRGLVYSIYSFSVNYSDTGLFGIYAGTGPKEISELVPVVCDQLQMITQDIREEEIERAKAQLKSSTLMALESTSARCERLARSMIQFGRPRPIEEIIESIEAVDKNMLQKLAQNLFKKKLTMASLGPVDNLVSYDEVVARLA